MALRTAIRKSLVIGATTRSLNSNSFRLKNKQIISSYIFNHENNNGSNQESSSHEVNWKLVCLFTAAVGLTPIALNCSLHKNDLLAEEEDEQNNDQEIIEKGNRYPRFIN